MPKRLFTLSAAAGLTIAGSIAALANPATAANVTTTVAVPVTCVFNPSPGFGTAFPATVKVTAPTSVRARRRFTVKVQVETDVQTDVPVSVEQMSFTNVLTATGARPTGPITLTQAPVDLAKGATVPAEVFTRRLTAGASGTTIAYTFVQHSYTFFHAGSTTRLTATCDPTAGGPVPIATTRVTR